MAIEVGDRVVRHNGTVRRATRHQVMVVPIARAVLIAVAQREETITHTDLVEAIGFYSRRGVGPLLDAVAADCEQRGEPLLPAIAVNANTQQPAWEYAYDDTERVERDQADVYDYWTVLRDRHR
ncbi:hypothetical protein [Nocardia wallacei]|uniref:hypothetical protein n=1 Tax=Nocardia wallacei TaxID=480035 RepID=UPI0024588C09|nr:hypothetical protein [Nocardia wallacei]